jgi:hypothetical protein
VRTSLRNGHTQIPRPPTLMPDIPPHPRGMSTVGGCELARADMSGPDSRPPQRCGPTGVRNTHEAKCVVSTEVMNDGGERRLPRFRQKGVHPRCFRGPQIVRSPFCLGVTSILSAPLGRRLRSIQPRPVCSFSPEKRYRWVM